MDQTSAERFVPPPPSVIYLTPGTQPAADKAPVAASDGPSREAWPIGAPPDPALPGPPPEARDEPRRGEANPEATPPASGNIHASIVADGAKPSNVPRGNPAPGPPLGPPPPYRPMASSPRSVPPAVEMAPAPPPAEVNLRVMGALGPPPPYRPIVQAGAVFRRGPAPDLEPWRLASLARMPAQKPDNPSEPAPSVLDDTDTDWSLPREAERRVEADRGADQPSRIMTSHGLEIGPGLAIGQSLAVGQFMGADGSRLGVGPRPRRKIGFLARRGGRILGGRTRAASHMSRVVLCGTGLMVAMLVLGFAAGFGRHAVMRAFPASRSIYASVGLAGWSIAAPVNPREDRTDAAPKCSEQPSTGSESQRSDCPDGKAEAAVK